MISPALTRSDRDWHAVYEALPEAYRDAIDNAYKAMRDVLVELPCQLYGDDRAEACVAAITRFVVASNPDNADVQLARKD